MGRDEETQMPLRGGQIDRRSGRVGAPAISPDQGHLDLHGKCQSDGDRSPALLGGELKRIFWHLYLGTHLIQGIIFRVTTSTP